MIVNVDNGRQVWLRMTGYQGPAGVRDFGATVELAYRGPAPRSLPAAVAIDGADYTAYDRHLKAALGFTVLIARPKSTA